MILKVLYGYWGFTTVFLILFIFSPFAYAYISITETDKRTDYPGKEKAQKIIKEYELDKWEKINFVKGCYFKLSSRGPPKIPPNIITGVIRGKNAFKEA